MTEQTRHPELMRLIDIVARLRAPDGCPWDRKQTEVTMAPHLLEETYEALDALQAADHDASREELGDVLMNVLMIAQIASEADRYDLEAVAEGIADKLVRRHPHVFGDVQADDADQVLTNWEAIKRQEKGADQLQSVLGGVPRDLPGLLRAYRVGEKAARTGFDWPDRSGPRAKLEEELAELDAALAGDDAEAVAQEMGDVLFSVVNVARHAGVNPEMAMRAAIDKFIQRFTFVENDLGAAFDGSTLDEMEAAWDRAKAQGL